MKNIIRIILQNAFYLFAAWFIVLILGQSVIPFTIIFIFFFSMGELLSYFFTRTDKELKMTSLNVFRYVTTILLFVLVFRPMFYYSLDSKTVDDPNNAQIFSQYVFPPNYVKLDFDYKILEKSILKFPITSEDKLTNHNIIDIQTNEYVYGLRIKDYDTETMYSKETWFSAEYDLVSTHYYKGPIMILKPLTFDVAKYGNYYSYGFMAGFIFINILIFVGSNRD